jgi:rhodanese-related sulfurtransferase
VPAHFNEPQPGFRLVEALPAQYYAEAHIPGALNIPLDDIEVLAPQLLPDKATPVVTYCASGPCGAGLPVEREAVTVTR